MVEVGKIGESMSKGVIKNSMEHGFKWGSEGREVIKVQKTWWDQWMGNFNKVKELLKID